LCGGRHVARRKRPIVSRCKSSSPSHLHPVGRYHTTALMRAPVHLANSALGGEVEHNLKAWYAAQADVPGIELHPDPDITWMLSNGATWANSGVSLRFSADNAGRRLDQILKRYAEHGRGAGFWVDDDATPKDIEKLLKA